MFRNDSWTPANDAVAESSAVADDLTATGLSASLRDVSCFESSCMHISGTCPLLIFSLISVNVFSMAGSSTDSALIEATTLM